MFDLMTVRPSLECYRADPMSAAEIDAHPDSGRIWATMMAIREQAARDIEDDLDLDGEGLDEAYDDGRNNAMGQVRAIINDSRENDSAENVVRKILSLTGEK